MNRTKTVLHIKTLLSGAAATQYNGESATSKRSLQVLVNHHPATKETSVELTTFDPTEAPSFTSVATEEYSGAAAPHSDSSGHEDNFDDPYLARVWRSINLEDEAPHSREVMNNSINDEDNSQLLSTQRTITFAISTTKGHSKEGNRQSATNESKDTDSLCSASVPFDEPLATRPPTTTKAKSLGTFHFPITATTAPAVKIKSTFKSLGSGSFEIPPKHTPHTCLECEVASPSSTQRVERFSFTSPLSAIGKSLLAIGASAIPRALQFDLLAQQHPPSTPVSQTEPKERVHKTKRMTRHELKSQRECNIWNAIVTKQIQVYGNSSVKTAEALLQLGNAYMHAGEYAQAVVTFQSACRIWNRFDQTKDNRLAFARVVDSIGMAWSRVTQDEDVDHCQKAMAALDEAFKIRFELLGPWHPDCVECLNKIASVHLHLREYSEACNAYFEVFHVRMAIFGKDHPSVAIAAHALGNVLIKLASTEEASNFFQIAVDIYERMNLPDKHPAFTSLMRDYKRLDRIGLISRLPRQPLPSHR